MTVAAVELRPYRDGDAAGVAALVEDSAPAIYRWKLNALRGPGRDEPSRWRTRVAAGPDGEIRGAGFRTRVGADTTCC